MLGGGFDILAAGKNKKGRQSRKRLRAFARDDLPGGWCRLGITTKLQHKRHGKLYQVRPTPRGEFAGRRENAPRAVPLLPRPAFSTR